MKNKFLDYFEAASKKETVFKLELNKQDLNDESLKKELNKYKGISELNLEDNSIKDVASLLQFKDSLRNLNLANNAVKNIWPLTELENLKILDLSENPIDLSIGFSEISYKEHGLYDILNFFEPLKKLELVIFPRRIKTYNSNILMIKDHIDDIASYFDKRGQNLSIEIFP